MVWGGISHGLKSPLIVIAGNLTGVRYGDEIIRGQIWTVRRPIEWANVMIGEKILTNSGYMGRGVILLEN
jgi:hypothetical protein